MALAVCGCGSNQNAANQVGIGADCSKTADCATTGEVCLTEFNGGYCGLSGCLHDTDCPQGSACVTDDQTNYCFLVCATKTDCNTHRSAANEADCTSSLTFVDGTMNRKVCRPPNSGTVADASSL
ncbi:MAG TPA: hypothetical protein VN962_10465 [Polyangia bacterium]|nr:hypothetical protein [Polyangia bacterium]